MDSHFLDFLHCGGCFSLLRGTTIWPQWFPNYGQGTTCIGFPWEALVSLLNYWMRILEHRLGICIEQAPRRFMWPIKFENHRWGGKSTDLWIQQPVSVSSLGLATHLTSWNPISLSVKRGEQQLFFRIGVRLRQLPAVMFFARISYFLWAQFSSSWGCNSKLFHLCLSYSGKDVEMFVWGLGQVWFFLLGLLL